MKIMMIGAGYVGLTTGACLAEIGHQVCCVDIDRDRIVNIGRGQIPIYEPGLSELIAANMERGRLSFSCDIGATAPDADFVFLAVGTPSNAQGNIDLSYVEAAARDIAPHISSNAIVVIKSTVVAGTARRIRRLIADTRGDETVAVASNPEFLREGSAIADFLKADRIVAGSDEEATARKLSALYAPLIRRNIPYISTSTVNAELIKYAANAFLALKIGFINDVSDLCENAEGDIAAVAEGIGLDRRIGQAFLSPGPGFGGSCFPKDTRAFAAMGRGFNTPQGLIELLIERNEARKVALAHRIVNALGNDRRSKRIAILGTAFKANTDDMREAAALTIIPLLQKEGMVVSAHDPQARASAEPYFPNVIWFDDPYAAAQNADALVVLTEWEDYRRLDLRRLAAVMRGDLIIDYRNILDSDAMQGLGLQYLSLGRPKVMADRSPRLGKRGSSGWSDADLAASPF